MSNTPRSTRKPHVVMLDRLNIMMILHQRSPKQHALPGFSLIELMIVLAIIAVLTSQAIPGYKTQLTRAKVLEGTMAMQPIKQEITMYVMEHGVLPPSLPIDNDKRWQFVQRIHYTSNGNTGDVHVAFDERKLRTRERLTMHTTCAIVSQSTLGCACYADNPANHRYLPTACRQSRQRALDRLLSNMSPH